VTVEAAISLCALITVLGMVLGGISMVTDQLRCTDAARAAARLLARGEHTLAAEALRTLAPRDARMEVRFESGGVVVTVLADAARGLLPVLELRAEAYAAIEPGANQAFTMHERARAPA
jgi:Flp pilus assembly protein TadG